MVRRDEHKKPGPVPHDPILPGKTEDFIIRRFPSVLRDALRREVRRRTQTEKRRVTLQEVFQRVIVAGLTALKIKIQNGEEDEAPRRE